jgi:hypothetical protein
MNEGTGLQVNRAEIARFAEVLFRYCDDGGHVAMRAFKDNADGVWRPDLWTFPQVANGLGDIITAAIGLAEAAAVNAESVVFCPPITTFKSADSAAEKDICNGPALSIDCDKTPEKAREILENTLGPATVTVASGGLWTDPDTGQVQDKVHVHWRLTEPTRQFADHIKLKEARRLAMILVGADASAVPLVHPLRWPGSLHAKAEPRLARIISLRDGIEIELDDALEQLREAVAAMPPGVNGAGTSRDGGYTAPGGHQPSRFGPEADALDIIAALAVIPNDERNWKRWSDIGMAVWHASGGSEAGYSAFFAWSSKFAGFDPVKTRERWENFGKYPPGGIGAGTLFHLAREAWPGFERPSELRQRRDNDPGSPPPRIIVQPPPADDHHTSASWANPDEFPVMAEEAFYGLPGEIVRTIEPHTESSSTTLLITLHVYFGNALGRGPYYQVEGTRHYTNLYSLLVGETGKSRKGTGDGRIRQIFRIADQDWCLARIHTALGSGEGLAHAIRDPVEREGENGPEVVDEGVADKRLLVVQSEFVGALRVMRREGNPLSAGMWDAWDGTPLGTLIKSSPDRCAEPHVSMLGHITEVELKRELDEVSMANGFGNRFLFACVRRARLLPFGGALPVNAVMEMAEKVSTAIQLAREIERVEWSDEGAEGWDAIYPKLSSGRPGLLGALTNRAEAQVARLALIYALWDGSSKIELKHLLAAQAVWDCCEASVGHIFGASLGDPVADTIVSALRRAGAVGMPRTEISGLFSRNVSSGRISLALNELLKLRLAMTRREASAGAGRPGEIWTAGSGVG